VARSPRIRQSAAAAQQNVAAASAQFIVTAQKIADLIDDLHDGISLKLVVAGKEIPVKLVIDPKDDAPKSRKG
jgi:hypothetical protein